MLTVRVEERSALGIGYILHPLITPPALKSTNIERLAISTTIIGEGEENTRERHQHRSSYTWGCDNDPSRLSSTRGRRSWRRFGRGRRGRRRGLDPLSRSSIYTFGIIHPISGVTTACTASGPGRGVETCRRICKREYHPAVKCRRHRNVSGWDTGRGRDTWISEFGRRRG